MNIYGVLRGLISLAIRPRLKDQLEIFHRRVYNEMHYGFLPPLR